MLFFELESTFLVLVRSKLGIVSLFFQKVLTKLILQRGLGELEGHLMVLIPLTLSD